MDMNPHAILMMSVLVLRTEQVQIATVWPLHRTCLELQERSGQSPYTRGTVKSLISLYNTTTWVSEAERKTISGTVAPRRRTTQRSVPLTEFLGVEKNVTKNMSRLWRYLLQLTRQSFNIFITYSYIIWVSRLWHHCDGLQFSGILWCSRIHESTWACAAI